jgi:hypothetical protein
MSDLTITITSDVRASLEAFMRTRGLGSASEAIQVAVQEGLEKVPNRQSSTDFRTLIGLAGGVPENPNPRFKSDDDLWEKD